MTTLITDLKNIDWQPKLGEIGGIVEGLDDIEQCISIILTTPKGSVPHRPEFGSDINKYLDYPANIAVPNVIKETVTAIRRWETRIEIVKVTATVNAENIRVTVEWKLKAGTQVIITEVNL